MFNLPLVKRQNISLDSVELLGYDKLSENETDKIIHFFLDDNKFQSIYNQTDEKIETLKKYNNRDHRLPETNNNGQKNQYYEYDVNNRSSNAERDNQRFVRDDNGNVYYTDDHYDTFSKIK